MESKFNVGETVFLKTVDTYSVATISSIELREKVVRYQLKGWQTISSSGYCGFGEEDLIKITEEKLKNLRKLEKNIAKIKKHYNKRMNPFEKQIEKFEKQKDKEIKETINNYVELDNGK